MNNKATFEKILLITFDLNYRRKYNKFKENSNMTMNQYFTFPWQLVCILRKLVTRSFYNKALPKSNLKSGSAPETGHKIELTINQLPNKLAKRPIQNLAKHLRCRFMIKYS